MNVLPKFDEFALILVRKLANSPISLAFSKRNVGWENLKYWTKAFLEFICDICHPYQELHRRGHEIGVFSITNRENPKYWTEGSYEVK